MEKITTFPQAKREFSKNLSNELETLRPQNRKATPWFHEELKRNKLKISYTGVQKWLNGLSFPEPQNWPPIEAVVKKSIRQLVFGKLTAPEIVDERLRELIELWPSIKKSYQDQLLDHARLAHTAQSSKENKAP